jgi:uncharacterized protein YdeI (YjbR/CyaY-like superfamily)
MAGQSKPAKTTAVPPEIEQALAEQPLARAAFEKLPPSHRREHVRYVSEAKQPETRRRRAARMIEMLLDGSQRKRR